MNSARRDNESDLELSTGGFKQEFANWLGR
jgi:hypothetical protein